MDKNELDKKAEEMVKWIRTQPQLPQKIEQNALKRFLLYQNCDLEATRKMWANYFEFRLKHERMFFGRDPLSKETQQMLAVENLIKLPGKTSKNYNLYLNRLHDPDPAKYDSTEAIKTLLMMMDLYGIILDVDSDGEVVIFDMAGGTLRHFLKASLSAVRIFMKAIQGIYPLRLKEIHVINATPVIEMIVGMLKPFMSGELFKMLHIHQPNSEKPYEYFPHEMLPIEYGGKAGRVSELREYWIEKLVQHRDIIIDDGYFRLNTL